MISNSPVSCDYVVVLKLAVPLHVNLDAKLGYVKVAPPNFGLAMPVCLVTYMAFRLTL